MDLGMVLASGEERVRLFQSRFPEFSRERLNRLSMVQLDVRSLAATLFLCFQRLEIAYLSPFLVPPDPLSGPGPRTWLPLPDSLDELERMCTHGLTIDGRVRGKLGSLVASRLRVPLWAVPSTGAEPPR